MASFSKHSVRGRSRFLLRLEELERRAVPTLFVVTTTADGGPGSLRQAVLASNSTPGNDEIWIPAGTYRLFRSGAGEDQGATGDLDLRDNVWLYGEGAALSVIDGNRLDRVFHVHPGVQAGFYAVTVRGGQALQGAGLYQEPTSTLRLWETVVSGNEAISSNPTTAAQGGGLYATTASTELWRATLDGNTAVGSPGTVPGGTGGPGQGGGAYLIGGNFVSWEAVFTNNTVTGGRGRTDLWRGGPGGGAAGGALHATNSNVLAHQGRVAGNSAIAGAGGDTTGPPGFGARGGDGGSGSGGGLAESGGRVEISEVPFSNNRVQGGQGGGSYSFGGTGGTATGGAVYLGSGNLAIYRGTLENNWVTGGTGLVRFGAGGFAGGGGVGVSGGTLVLLETEVRNNVALGGNGSPDYGPGGGDAHGGGIWVGGGDAILADTTIRGNRATGGPSPFPGAAGSGIGGGLYVTNIWAYGRNVIIEDNLASTSDPDLFGMLYPF